MVQVHDGDAGVVGQPPLAGTQLRELAARTRQLDPAGCTGYCEIIQRPDTV